ncbi:hypothetical protein [Pseudomonas asiatica]|uniref:hypothetical protein n=1 Tax=Pseudomonas asiatica TaxID=2219225 RepID=UPI0010C096E7|nr:hypothetical protein [Pseudomonas asiatica]
MAHMNLLKVAALGSLLSLSALAGAATDSTNPYAAERDPEGFLKEPICAFHKSVRKSLEVFLDEVPTGLRAANGEWDMEILADPADGSWTLVGKSRDPEAKSYQLCHLARGLSDTPYTQEVWYRKYFQGTP